LARRKSGEEVSEDIPRRKVRPATTPEGRERQLVNHAVDLAEKQLREGTASAQVITHYLKLGSTRERLEQERLRNENDLLRAKTDAMASAEKTEELYRNALNAMRSYTGTPLEPDEPNEE
jgi:hypothetical protein